MKKKPISSYIIILTIALCCFCRQSLAQKAPVPIRHSEEEIEILNVGKDDEKIILRVNVRFEADYEGSTVSLDADEVIYERKAGKVSARGNVRLSQDDATVTCSECIYYIEDRKAEFFGDPVFKSGSGDAVDSWRGKSILVEFSDGGVKRIVGRNGRGRIFPQEKDLASFKIAPKMKEAIADEPSDATQEHIEPPDIERKMSE